jgi:hypothetical protein
MGKYGACIPVLLGGTGARGASAPWQGDGKRNPALLKLAGFEFGPRRLIIGQSAKEWYHGFGKLLRCECAAV